MQSIRNRLTLNYLIVLLIGMTLAGMLAWLAVERLYVNTQRDNLLAQARLMATALQGTALPTQPAEPYSQLSNIAPGIHTRLLSEGGAVIVGLPLAQEFTQGPAAENYASIPTVDLVRRPEIYLFDDSFSALDYSTDAALRTALARETTDATVVIVAQRVNTIRDADRILVLDDGQVVGTGTHTELMHSNETYREIVLSQLTEEEAA